MTTHCGDLNLNVFGFSVGIKQGTIDIGNKKVFTSFKLRETVSFLARLLLKVCKTC
jgi:hypothetical protein